MRPSQSVGIAIKVAIEAPRKRKLCWAHEIPLLKSTTSLQSSRVSTHPTVTDSLH
jgi:hypothetical protein